MDSWVWFVVAGLLLVAEMLVVHLLFASLALAALAAGIGNLLGASLAIQGVAFALFALISLVGIRPIALRHMKKQSSNASTNVDALVGATALTTTDVDQLGGQVKLSGEIWSAHTLGEKISSGERVLVVAIDGATARVRKIEER
ncbi:MAG: NfeD family protein [Actinobacteria bacterium]|nr:NfeD family protein [Actinomycetota bacterium]